MLVGSAADALDFIRQSNGPALVNKRSQASSNNERTMIAAELGSIHRAYEG